MVYVIVGGRRSLWGAIFGAIILTLIPEVFRMLKEYQPYLFATALMLVIFLMPEGLVGLPERFRLRSRRDRRERLRNA
jgi:branched-chain amino acid transport system permease protein